MQELINRHTEELAASITQEQGKTLADARGDVFRGLGGCCAVLCYVFVRGASSGAWVGVLCGVRFCVAVGVGGSLAEWVRPLLLLLLHCRHPLAYPSTTKSAAGLPACAPANKPTNTRQHQHHAPPPCRGG